MAIIRDRCARCGVVQYRTYVAGVDPISQADAPVLCDPCKELPEPEPVAEEKPKRKRSTRARR